MREPLHSRACAAALRVIATESDGLREMATAVENGPLGSTFKDCVERMTGLAGRVVTTGMGKSGHIARKIAATLASTGTPAIYVHPAEASHGDLGMITPGDMVLALSNSGRADDFVNIIAYCRRFGIPLVSMTRKAESALAQESDLALILPASPEACPIGLAPTTSSTMMLVLGDALAVALLEQRDFSATDFKVFHPGGQIGNQLLRVADLMHTGDDLPLVNAPATMAEALMVMTRKRLGCVGIVDDAGKLCGIITDGDLRRHMSPDLLAKPAAGIMTRQPKTIRPGALAAEAVHLMNTKSITCLFVMEEEKPVGVIHIHDCLRAGVV
ncbi:MAG: D-arabinose 5-phosphate [Alphaproteobacteria bacterium GWF2_58_20]|nr:MAG: D-arabinose 5-phosphate [Alphaproteobacteria bacterium GWF2_58_20]